MAPESITCPHCHHHVELNEVLTHDIRENLLKEIQPKLQQRQMELKRREEELQRKTDEMEAQVAERIRAQVKSIEAAAQQRAQQAIEQTMLRLEAPLENQQKVILEQREREKTHVRQEQELQQKLREMDSVVEERVRMEAKSIEAAAEERMKLAAEQQTLRLQTQLEAQEKRIRESQEREKVYLQKEQELQSKIEAQEIEVSRAINQRANELRHEYDQKQRLKEIEFQTDRESLQRKVEELQRKLEQGSQQLQGEAMELDLEAVLRASFPQDAIEEVGKGIRGGDCMQRVRNQLGNQVGTILWEVKRTKTFSEQWIQKLKDDMIGAKADLGIILTMTLPKDVTTFTEMNGIWITNHACLLGLATALRSQLVGVAAQRQMQAGKQTKADMLYDFVGSAEFRQRIESVVTPFVEMKISLDKERSAMNKLWATREKQLERVLDNISGLTGALGGITGKNIEIDSFELEQKQLSE